MKIKILVLFSMIVFSSLILFNSCGKNKVVPNICFKNDILPIFISKCTTSGCHSSNSGKKEGGVDLSKYEGIMTKVKPYHPLASEVYTQCRGNNPSMPPSPNLPLTSTELEYIKYWIHTGAKNLDNCIAKTCDTVNVSFSGKIQPLINTWCVGCHNTSNAGGGFDLSTYQGVKNSITPTNRLSGSIEHLSGYSSMPKGATMLDPCDIKAIQNWISSSYPNN